MLKTLDLFSGIGGFSLGLERTGNFETVAFCEIDKYCKLLLQKHWKGVKIYDDVKKITKEGFEADGIPSPDVITGGFPCQPFSVAGKQKGTSDNRHLWPEMFRIIKAFKPRYVIGENVRGIINIQDGMVFETVCTDLESEGYEVQPFIIPAAGVGAPHRRERVWIIAIREESMVNSDNIRFKQHNTAEEEASRRRSSATFEPTGNVADTENGRRQQTQSERREGTERGSIDSRGIEREGQDIGRDENVENSRRTLQQGTKFGAANEDEIGKENANQHQRSSSSSESDVANTDSRRSSSEHSTPISGQREKERVRSEYESSRGGETREGGSADVADTNISTKTQRGEYTNTEKESNERRNNESGSTSNVGERRVRETGKSFSYDVADTENIGTGKLRHFNQTQRREGSHSAQLDSSSSTQRKQGWWSVEPNVGRVAHGISGRIHRLKGLGNAIVPQIAEEIGRAIVKAENDIQ